MVPARRLNLRVQPFGSDLDGGRYPLAVEVFQLPAVNSMVVGHVEHGVVDALQGAADGEAEAHTEKRAVGDDQDAAAAELLGQCFQRGQPAGGRLVLAFCAAETAIRRAQCFQFRAGLQALRGSEATLGELGHAPVNAEPQPGSDEVGGLRGTAQRRGHDRVPLVVLQDGDGVAGLAAADVVQRNVRGSLQPALRVPVCLAVADKG